MDRVSVKKVYNVQSCKASRQKHESDEFLETNGVKLAAAGVSILEGNNVSFMNENAVGYSAVK